MPTVLVQWTNGAIEVIDLIYGTFSITGGYLAQSGVLELSAAMIINLV